MEASGAGDRHAGLAVQEWEALAPVAAPLRPKPDAATARLLRAQEQPVLPQEAPSIDDAWP